jgi:hypothetical protein
LELAWYQNRLTATFYKVLGQTAKKGKKWYSWPRFFCRMLLNFNGSIFTIGSVLNFYSLMLAICVCCHYFFSYEFLEYQLVYDFNLTSNMTSNT